MVAQDGGTGELELIVDCVFGPPCIDPIFGPTSAAGYWSSVAGASNRSLVWFVCPAPANNCFT